MSEENGKRKRQVIEQVEYLERWMSLIQEAITNLALKIEPVLSLSIDKTDEKQKPDQKCKLAMNLEVIADQARDSYRRLQDLIERTEV